MPLKRKARHTEPKTGKGWHQTMQTCPHKGKSIAVEPIRELRDVRRIQKMLADHPRDYALFVVGTRTNLRGSDLLALRWRDVLDVDGSVCDRLSLTERKTRKIKHLDLQPDARRAIQALLPKDGSTPDRDGFLFPSRKVNGDGERRLSIQTLHALVKRWTKEAGIRGEWHCRGQLLYGHGFTFFRVPLVAPPGAAASADSDVGGV